MAKIYIGNQEIGGTTKYENVISSITSKELQPNVFYDFGVRKGETITLTFANAPTNQVNEYMWQILNDDNIGGVGDSVVVELPLGIKWVSNENVLIQDTDTMLSSKTELTLTGGYTYQFNIFNGCGLIASFENGTLSAPSLTINGSTLSWSNVKNAQDYFLTTSAPVSKHTTIDAPANPSSLVSFDLSTWFSPSGTLATPSNLTPSSTQNSITLSWTSVSSANGYTVYYKKSSDANYTSTTTTTNSVTITGLTASTSYDLYVKANAVTSSNTITVIARSNKYNDTSSSTSYTYTTYNESANSSVTTTSTQASQ